MINWKSYVLPLVGLLFLPLPLFSLLYKVIVRAFAAMLTIKTRTTPPPELQDSKLGDHHFVQLPGLKMHYVEKGKDDNKTLMVFLHGFPEFWYSWRNQLTFFSDKYWCVAPDMRGYNDTDKPEGIHNYSLDLIATDVKNLVQALGREKCILVGHDWGGAIGYYFCHLYPEMVISYVACNLPHPRSLEEQRKGSLKQFLMSWYVFFFQCPMLPEIYIKSFDYDMFSMFGEAAEAYKYAFRDPAAIGCAINYYRHAAQIGPAKAAKPSDPGIQVPVLSVFGTADKFLSLEAEMGGKKYVKDFTQKLVEGGSHWAIMEKHQEFNRIIQDYLNSRKY